MYDFDIISSFGSVSATGKIKQVPNDFIVEEILSFSPVGVGDHVYLKVKKTSSNTAWVVDQLINLTGLKSVDIGYAGLKDRHGVTTQWFSLHMPNQTEPDWALLPTNINVLKTIRHNKKLRAGAIDKNNFKIIIHDVLGDIGEIGQKLKLIQSQGFPNYFGSQRFGHQGANVYKLVGMGKGRRRMSKTQRGLYISSGRSYLFNQIVKARVKQGNWNQMLEGDVLALQGSRSIFVPDEIDPTILQRIEAHDVHPAAVLWGCGDSKTSTLARSIEENIISLNQEIKAALEKTRVDIAYRAMRISVPELRWQFDSNTLFLEFSLPSGAYATSLLTEFIAAS